MKEKIGRLSKGILDYKPAKLIISEEAVNITVETGKTFHGSFRVYNSENKIIKGLLYSSCYLFKLKEDKFISSSIEIGYDFLADYLEPGEIDGYISIVSECGEMKLPFTVKIIPPVCSTSIGDINDINLFTELAMLKPEEAKSMFLSIGFKRILKHYYSNMLSLYDALLKNSNIYAAIEEFLIAAGLKEKILINIDRYEYSYDTGLYNFIDYINIVKNTWGYYEAYISSETSFIEFDKTVITSDDFINNECSIPFIIKADKIKTGTHIGVIRIESIYQSIEVKITCRCTKLKNKKHLKDRRERMLYVKLTSNYIDFRTNKTSAKEYVKTAEKLISELYVHKSNNILNRLYHVHLLYVDGKIGAAVNMLDGLNITKETHAFLEYAAYLYLKVILNKESHISFEAYDEFQRLYIYDDSQPLMFFMMLYLNKRYDTDIVKKHEDIKAYVMRGIISPIIYYEAASLLKANPFLMKELGIFEQKILLFMIKHDIYEKSIAITIHSHVLKIKTYNQILYYILKRYYEKYQMKELLMAITAMLIRGHKTDVKYFYWYEKAIKERLKIAELFEHYLLTARNAGITTLDSSIYTYFLNSAGLDKNKKSWLYYTILLNNNKELIDVYYENICTFVIEQLEKKKIDNVLSYIYKSILNDEQILKKCISNLPDVMFIHEVTCYNSNIEKVIIIYEELSQEETYILKDGHAYVKICSNNALLFLADSRGNRYAGSVEYEIDRLLYTDVYAKLCFIAGITTAEIAIWLQSRIDNSIAIDKDTYRLKDKAITNHLLKEELKQSYIRELIYYHYNNFESSFLEKYLLLSDYHYVLYDERNRYIECLISMNQSRTALNMIEELGYEGIDIIRAQKLCSYMIRNIQENQENIDIAVKLCWMVFNAGSISLEQLEFLSDSYYGTLDEMYSILKLARESDIDTERLEERLIIQHLFTESSLPEACDIFSRYYKQKANKKLIKAFLTYYSYQYLISSQNVTIKPVFFDIADKELNYEENEICLLACLKYLSKKELLNDKEILFVDYHMNKLLVKKTVLPFFKDFAKHMKISSYLLSKYYVEYYTRPLNNVTIHYSIEKADSVNENKDKYIISEMKHVCYGIYIYEISLFYGEAINYYITDEYEGVKEVTDTMMIKIEDSQAYGEELFMDKLNKILEAKTMDDSELIENIESYMKLRHAADKLFTPLT